jgi:hypothetical protein
MNRNGKIARLPQGIREGLNRRLQDNELGDKILEWLNGQEVVQTVIKEQFEGAAITKQNLSEWRMGGFAEWVLGQEVVYEAQDTEEGARRLDAVTDSSLPDRLATVLAGRYASLLARWDGEVTEAFMKKLRALGPLCREICALRRSHHNAIRTKIAQERHEMEKEEGRMKDEELGETALSGSVAPGQTNFQSHPETASPADVATSCRHPEGGRGKEEGRVKNVELGETAPSGSVAPGQTEYKASISDNRIYPPMAASDPNSEDIHAIDKVPKKRNPDNCNPDPFSYPSYWHWIKTCKPKILPPNHPKKPPTQYTF